MPAFYYASNTTVQFVGAGGTADLGVNYPSDFCQSNPNIITTIFRNGTLYTSGSAYTGGTFPSFSLTPACRPSPLLSDIEIDADGNMVLGIMDRSRHQWGFANYGKTGTSLRIDWRIGGEVLKASKCNSNALTWSIENDGGLCGTVGSAMQQNDQGLGGGEFYYQDFGYISGDNPNQHQETSTGTLAVWQGKNEVLLTVMDPIRELSGGVSFLNNLTGATNKRAELYHDPYGGTIDGTAGKANGLGDIELLCNAQPIEIGNRIFMDTNSDGIQDANEIGLDGIKVELWKAGAKVTDVTTANGGQWYFTNLDSNTDKAEKSEGATYSGAAYGAATGTVTAGAVSFTGLKHNTQYTFRIWNAADACFTDITITTPAKTCATPCPKICSPIKVTKL